MKFYTNRRHDVALDEPRIQEVVATTLGYDEDDLRAVSRSVARASVYDCEYCMPWRDHMCIHVVRGVKLPSPENAPACIAAKHFE